MDGVGCCLYCWLRATVQERFATSEEFSVIAKQYQVGIAATIASRAAAANAGLYAACIT